MVFEIITLFAKRPKHHFTFLIFIMKDAKECQRNKRNSRPFSWSTRNQFYSPKIKLVCGRHLNDSELVDINLKCRKLNSKQNGIRHISKNN